MLRRLLFREAWPSSRPPLLRCAAVACPSGRTGGWSIGDSGSTHRPSASPLGTRRRPSCERSSSWWRSRSSPTSAMRSGRRRLGFLDWRILVWAGAIALVHLMPMPRRMPFPFSLSFPLQLSVALLYPPPVAAVIVFAASIDQEELRGEHPPLTVVFRHAQVALFVLAQGTIFHSLTDLHDRWFVVGSVVILTALIGYAISTMVTAEWQTLRYRHRLDHVLRAMHEGVMAEFLLSYLGLALFSVLVAITTRKIGLWAIVGLHRPARVRLADVAPDAFPRARDRGARSQAGGERVSGVARPPHRPSQPAAVPTEPREGDRGSRGGGREVRRDADGPRPLQGDQRRPRTPLRRQASSRRSARGSRSRCATAT